MKRLLPLVALTLIPIPSALADGCPPSACGTTSVAPPGSPVTLVRRTGQQGPAEGYDLATGAFSFGLPSGILAADGRTFASTSMVRIARGGTRTMIRRFGARTGRLRSVTAIPGRWHVTAASADGRRVGLTRYRKRSVVIGVADSALRFRAALPGNWEIEALSADGSRVFLVHWNRTGGYTLENIDTRTGRLRPTRLDEPGEKMSGFAQTAVATQDGRWLLTVYLKADSTTFLHALDLRTGVAHCVDLPLVGGPAAVGSTALALSPDERKLYLASPFLGRVLTVDRSTLRLTRDVRFRGVPEQQAGISVGPSAAMTANGRMLAFTGARAGWLYDAAYGVVRKRLDIGSSTIGIGFRPDGRRLVTIAAPGVARAFDAATGVRVR